MQAFQAKTPDPFYFFPALYTNLPNGSLFLLKLSVTRNRDETIKLFDLPTWLLTVRTNWRMTFRFEEGYAIEVN